MPSAAVRRLSPLQWAGVDLGGCAVLLALLGLLAPASAFFFPLLSLWASVGLFVLALCVLRVAGVELDFFHKAVVFGIWAVAVVYFYWTLSSRSFVYVWDYANYLLKQYDAEAAFAQSAGAGLAYIFGSMADDYTNFITLFTEFPFCLTSHTGDAYSFSQVFCILPTLLVLLAIPVSAFAADDVFTPAQKAYYKNLGLQGTTVNVYNWGEYISEGQEGAMNTVKEFERLTGAKVNYTNFESNENMYSKLSGGGVSYDVIIPSDYMIQRLLEEDMLLPLDYGNIPNYDKYIAPDCKGLYFDPQQKYTVCYNIGTTVLIYNKKLVKEAPKSWSVLWDEQYRDKVLMFNNSRDAFALAQFMLGQDLNTTSEEDWNAAAELLAKQKDAVHPVYVMDEVFNLMESGEYAFATYYAGDYILMQDNNPDLGCCFPEEGVNLFYDAMCVPKCTQNKKGAEAFINFMQEPQVALANQEYIYYASPNLAVRQDKNNSLYGNPVVYPKVWPKGQYFYNLPQNILELQNDLWARVKSGQLSADGKAQDRRIYWASGAVGAAAVVAVAARLIHKARKNKEQDLRDLY